MAKIPKTVMVVVRMSPEEKSSAINLADQLGLNISDVVRLAVNETIRKGSLSIEGLSKNNPKADDERANS